MRVWVTGGAGCLGSHLVERLLSEGHRVDALDDLSTGSLANLSAARGVDGFGFHQIDVTAGELPTLAARHQPDVIVHAAGRSVRPAGLADPLAETNATVVGTLSVLTAARLCGARVIAVVHATPDAADPPSTPAEVSAWTVVDQLRVHRTRLGVPTTCVVLANLYGPRQAVSDGGPLVARMIDDLVVGRSLTINRGDHTRDLVYVDDAVDAVCRCLDRPDATVVPVGSGTIVRPSEVAAMLGEVAGRRIEILDAAARRGDLDRPAWPLEPAAQQLGWAPWTELRDGLAACWAERSGD